MILVRLYSAVSQSVPNMHRQGNTFLYRLREAMVTDLSFSLFISYDYQNSKIIKRTGDKLTPEITEE